MPLAGDRMGDRLVRGVLAGDMAAPALDAEIDAGLGDIVEVAMLPFGEARHGAADEILHRPIALFVHPGFEPALELIDDVG